MTNPENRIIKKLQALETQYNRYRRLIEKREGILAKVGTGKVRESNNIEAAKKIVEVKRRIAENIEKLESLAIESQVKAVNICRKESAKRGEALYKLAQAVEDRYLGSDILERYKSSVKGEINELIENSPFLSKSLKDYYQDPKVEKFLKDRILAAFQERENKQEEQSFEQILLKKFPFSEE